MSNPPRIDLEDYSATNLPPHGAIVNNRPGRCPGLRRVRLFLGEVGYLRRDSSMVLTEVTHYLTPDHFEPFAVGVLGNVHHFNRPWGVPIHESIPVDPGVLGSYFQFIDPPSMWYPPEPATTETLEFPLS